MIERNREILAQVFSEKELGSVKEEPVIRLKRLKSCLHESQFKNYKGI
jgi:hypothetical protein